MNDISKLDARALSAAIHRRDISCREVMTATLRRIEAINPTINAIVNLRDGDDLLAQADTADAELDAGRSRGWLHGIPQAVKDLAAAKGLPMTRGSPLFRNFQPAEDAIHIARTREAGAIVVGKTNTPEFGLGSHSYNPLFGVTRNPWDTTKTAGGSSGGAAAALAARLVPLADGSDMMGSLRNPAAFNNVVGFRPSIGRVPSGPSPEVFLNDLSTNGPMGRSVADVAALLATQAGHDPRSPRTLDGDGSAFAALAPAKGKAPRIGWLGDLDGYLAMEAGILDLCEKALEVFTDLGCVVEATPPGFAMDRVWRSWTTLRHAIIAGDLGALYDDPETRALLKPAAIWEVENGMRLGARDIHAASLERTAWLGAVLRLFERHDYLVLPSAQVFPFPAQWEWPKEITGRTMDSYHRWMEVAVPASLLGLPTLALPTGFNTAGLPMGFQLIGAPRDDAQVLSLAMAYEGATDWLEHEPDLARCDV